MRRLSAANASATPPPAGRAGVTLTEVLISLMILSIGVVSVFSLYPVALLRSIRATQATNAKIASGNALDRLVGDEKLLNGAPFWRPGAQYVVGDVVSVPPVSGIISPTANRFVVTGFVPVAGGPPVGTSSLSQPTFDVAQFAEMTNTGDDPAVAANPRIIWQLAVDPDPSDAAPYPAAANYGGVANARSLNGSVYCVDPYGWTRLHELGGAAPEGRQVRDGYGTAPRLDAGLRSLLSGTAGWGTRNLALWGADLATINSAFADQFVLRDEPGPPPRTNVQGTIFDADGNRIFADGQPTAAQVRLLAELQSTRVDSFLPLVEAYEPLPGTGPTAEVLDDGAGSFVTFRLPPGEDLGSLLSIALDLESAGIDDGVVMTVGSTVTDQSVDIPLTVSTVVPPPVGYGQFVPVGNPSEIGLPAGLVTARSLGGSTTAEVLPLRVAISVRDNQYSWLYTIRRTRNGVEGDVVTFFRRAVQSETESGFAAWFGNNPFDTADDRATPGAGGWTPRTLTLAEEALAGANRSRAWIARGRDYTGGGPAGGGVAEANIAVGRRVFDSVGGHWYEITSVLGTTPDPTTVFGDAGFTIVTVELDRPVERVTDLQTPGAAPGTLLAGPTAALTTAVADSYPQAVIPRGVIEVRPFSLGVDGDGR